MLITVGFVATDILGSPRFWNDFNCKSFIYLRKLMRDLSICATCLRSVLQAIILSPRSPCSATFKHKSSHQSQCSFFFPLWVYNMFVSSCFIISTVSTPNVTSAHLLFVTESCSLWPQDYLLRQIFFTLFTFQDVVFIGLMALACGYMVILLYRHKMLRQTQHLYSTNLSSKASLGKGATKTILLLMGFFVVMYFLDCIVSFSRMVWYNDPVHLHVQILVADGYVTHHQSFCAN